jgi:hypothetical protein
MPNYVATVKITIDSQSFTDKMYNEYQINQGGR